MARQFFLAKSGKTFGPLALERIEAMRESGEYENYSWFWDQDRPGWQPIDPPPSAPSIAEAKPDLVSAIPGASGISGVSEEALRNFSVICHNQQSVVSGFLANVTDGGCELIARSPATSPEFQSKLSVQLHLLDVSSGRSMNVGGRVGRIERRDGLWCYRIHWRQCPRILRERPNEPRASAGEART